MPLRFCGATAFLYFAKQLSAPPEIQAYTLAHRIATANHGLRVHIHPVSRNPEVLHDFGIIYGHSLIVIIAQSNIIKPLFLKPN